MSNKFFYTIFNILVITESVEWMKLEVVKMKNAVVMNLEYVSKDVARRIVDTVSGAVQALDGNMEKVSNSIFVVAPYNYDIVSEITKEKIETRMASNWIK